MNAPVALALTAGMVAAVNPCGFSLLPAYIGLFVGSVEADTPVPKRLARAGASAVAVTAGFVTVFSVAGVILDRVSTSFQQRLPFVTLIVGAFVVLAGVAVLCGRKVALPILITRHRKSGRGVVSMVSFGVTYAVSSLSCTVGPRCGMRAGNCGSIRETCRQTVWCQGLIFGAPGWRTISAALARCG